MPYEVKSLNEECGVFGIWGQPQASDVTYYGLHALQHRGQEGAGITSKDGHELKNVRGLGLLSEVFRDPERLASLTGDAAIGHVRYTTSGSKSLDNIQPLMFHFTDGDMSLAHNGNLTNAFSLKKRLENEGAIFHTTSDTEILIHLLRRSSHTNFLDKLKESLRTVRGGFAFLLMTETHLYAAVDPNGLRPLVLGQMKTGAFVVASETCALDSVGATFIRDIQPGELIIIDDGGYKVDYYTKDTQLAICSMEYVYFARPDSDIHGVNVHTARKEMGRLLAQEQPVDADIVVGVPNSSLSAASGYAEASGIPYEMGLVKNQYIARTFIQPNQDMRERSVRMKLSPVKGVVAGKKVALIDDSIVRGTTSKYIVRLLLEAGAKEVHLRIASPALKFPCYYGIDIQSTDELIAAHKNVAEMNAFFGSDSLGFLSVESLIKAIGLKTDAPNGGLCVAYFNGDYPTPLYDFEDELQTELKRLNLENHVTIKEG
ncbi:amidophosphoribosyltransferase [Agrilactobacillus composti DSM 18527 = JCM 14202]|uniref:Amidophosphoribosyltransferase n=1 Tax=Agrilactobacillus composti DSM 18527 = JCM 14202 TaxID=1423734 RepID=X0PS21_9LACO|nr:amidophosphoribosyltransferase [Agrilactobacillus composti]KRM33340.1 amidophosphoribosyltransferase [Agrilactobacillus composti DSM 18527 = JCM 14202]GAF40677.1 amidophosphoribosyltransferase [Agrilactobacillus composti DSM 18527 = JCM 14202]